MELFLVIHTLLYQFKAIISRREKQPTPNPVPKIVIIATTDSRITLKDQFDDCDVSFFSLATLCFVLFMCLLNWIKIKLIKKK